MRFREGKARGTLPIAAVLAMVLLVWAQAQAQVPGHAGGLTAGTAVPLTTAAKTGEIAGVVTDATTGKPIADARVMIFGPPGAGVAGGIPAASFEYPCVGCAGVGQIRATTGTDAEGRYKVRVATPGAYVVQAAARGYAQQAYAGPKAVGYGGSIVLSPAERKENVDIRLPRAAVLAGRVTDKQGEPIPSAYILLEWYGMPGWGHKRWLPVIMKETDDRGDYRVWGLPPGRYRIKMRYQAGLQRSSSSQSGLGDALFFNLYSPGAVPQSFSPLYYYPGVTEAAAAKTITLTAGEARRGVNVAVAAIAAVKPAQPTETGECEISGTVTDAKTDKPLGNAWVAWGFAGQPGGPGDFEVRADAEGQFAFHNLPCNVRAPLRAWKPGYVLAFASPGSLYGQQWPPPPPPARVRPWSVKNVTLALTREGVITGKITDSKGEPEAWVRVEAVGLVTQFGQSSYRSACCEVMTDDRGKYRIFGLEPGQYYVAAQFRRGPDLGGLRYSTGAYLYYPRWARLDAARAIRVRAGETVKAIDFAGKPPRMYSISGVVQGDARNEIGRGLNVFLRPATGAPAVEGARSSWATIAPTGEFRIEDVLPGKYTAWAEAFLRREQWAAWTPVTVTRKDVTGVALVPHPGWGIAGELKIEGQPKGRFQYQITAKLAGWPTFPVIGTEARAAEDGKFELNGIFPGEYQISVSGFRVHKFWPRPGGSVPWVPGPLHPPPNDYLKAATFGKQNVRTGYLRVDNKGPSGILKLTVSWNGAVVEGTVTNAAGESAKDADVFLVPEKRLRGAYWLVRRAETYSKGRYYIPAVAPGKYRVVAIKSEDLGKESERATFQERMKQGKLLVVREGEKKTVNLRQME